MTRLPLCLLLLPLSFACHPSVSKDDSQVHDSETGNDDTEDSTVDDTGDTSDEPTLDGPCEAALRWGAFSVDSNEDYAYAFGSVADAVFPTSVPTRVLDSGECTIWRRENPFCHPPCDTSHTCSLEGECVPLPAAQDLGTVTLTGLLEPVTMKAAPPTLWYWNTSLPNPPWEAGTLIEMHATGGAWEPVSLHARAPVDLAPSNLEWTLRRGEPLLLAWNSVPADAGTELALNLTIDLHGTTPARLECIFADDGEGEVPADALEALIELGMTGFPAGTLARRSADHAALGAGGCLDFMATSSRLPSVTIEGYTPCNTDRDCPKGMDCNEMLQRCE